MFTAATLPWGLSWRNSLTNIDLPGLLAVLEVLVPDFLLAELGFGFELKLPTNPISDLILLMRVEPMLPFILADAHASFTALTLPWGLLVRNLLTKSVLL
jgi:hypothetical protein